ncbi:MAG: thioredoxin-dependent thiol peroxidase [Alphaproteobacteria bacterium]|jgi:thioredoxin-dependent peroxiredoxin|nr:thioredoxin-dependent thiol peroxidase [Rhodospirillaceae bacterium]MBT6510943.1 thioredoxin-dependent thiol peroxidase [Rhodospirillaceae bacterium]MBT7614356.1 thioredoxin-dependent thiol peroxidase [Rhodospirillaceae bacterium]MBT7646552.1 thioredoxin-dependent thiol peroxidase [Rhodospirillaceae bacterium]MDG2482228.1 thioredoxin-dependent thiol peroxidase [Alphaproteobacteria bacterium]
MSAIESGDTAPDFEAPTDGGGSLKLSSLAGKNVILYFYPKDDTPGCTKEACGFRDTMADLAKAGTVVLGVSKDSIKRHDNFKAKYDLNFQLVSDEDGAICEAYGVWVEKMNYGRTYMGIERATFLIDGKGVVREVWRKVRVKGHVEAVTQAATNLA